jgi:hypothetical protein
MCHLQEISLMRDTGQILDDLIPISRQDGGIRIGDTGYGILVDAIKHKVEKRDTSTYN